MSHVELCTCATTSAGPKTSCFTSWRAWLPRKKITADDQSCRNCCNERLSERRRRLGPVSQWKEMKARKVSRGDRLLTWGRVTSSARCGSDSLCKGNGPRGFLKKHPKTQPRAYGSWQEELDILRNVRSLSKDGSSMRKAFHGGKSENWADFLKNDKLSGLKCESATRKWSRKMKAVETLRNRFCKKKKE